MARNSCHRKASADRVRQIRDHFLRFPRGTHFPGIERHGERGSTFDYPACLIMLMGV